MKSVCCIVNGHREGSLLVSTMKSVLQNYHNAKAHGYDVSILLVLDNPDQLTREVADKLDGPFSRIEVSFGDPSLARNHAVSLASSEFVSFIDGDDIWSSTWILKALNFESNNRGDHILHPEINYYFSTEHGIGKDLISLHPSSLDSHFDKFVLASHNLWTALGFGKTEIYRQVGFPRNNMELGLGYEDWSFNVAVLADGVEHLVVPETTHFIREKASASVMRSHGKSSATFIPSDIWSH